MSHRKRWPRSVIWPRRRNPIGSPSSPSGIVVATAGLRVACFVWSWPPAYWLPLAGSVFFSYQRFSLTPVDAQVTQADEGVVIDRGGQSLTAQAGLKLTADDRLIVPDSAAASITYADDTRVVFGPQAAATLQAGRGPTKRISLERGDFVAHVAKQVEGAPFEASTPNARVRVLGTRFLLAATPTVVPVWT